MLILSAILSVVLGLFGGWVIIGNWWIVIRWYIWRKPDSLVPFVGGIFFALAMISYPEPRVRHWAWIPLIVDLGCSLIIHLAQARCASAICWRYIFCTCDD